MRKRNLLEFKLELVLRVFAQTTRNQQAEGSNENALAHPPLWIFDTAGVVEVVESSLALIAAGITLSVMLGKVCPLWEMHLHTAKACWHKMWIEWLLMDHTLPSFIDRRDDGCARQSIPVSSLK